MYAWEQTATSFRHVRSIKFEPRQRRDPFSRTLYSCFELNNFAARKFVVAKMSNRKETVPTLKRGRKALTEDDEDEFCHHCEKWVSRRTWQRHNPSGAKRTHPGGHGGGRGGRGGSSAACPAPNSLQGQGDGVSPSFPSLLFMFHKITVFDRTLLGFQIGNPPLIVNTILA